MPRLTMRNKNSSLPVTFHDSPRGSLGAQDMASRGFTLLEVLVALLILAIGLLGLAALQTMSIKFNHQSYERTQATFLAYDILDRMRANPSGNYSAAATSDPGCIAAACTVNQLAEHDLFHWRQAVGKALAASAATVSTSGNAASVTLTWFENDIPQTLTLNSRL